MSERVNVLCVCVREREKVDPLAHLVPHFLQLFSWMTSRVSELVRGREGGWEKRRERVIEKVSE